MTPKNLPQQRSDECSMHCVLFVTGLPRCSSICQQLRWEIEDAKEKS